MKRFILPPFLPLKIDLHMSTVGAKMRQDEAKLGILDPILGLCWLMLELCWAILEHLGAILKKMTRYAFLFLANVEFDTVFTMQNRPQDDPR